jgi:21S rRNA (uridine2791-2'-O)-methyltransferase
MRRGVGHKLVLDTTTILLVNGNYGHLTNWFVHGKVAVDMTKPSGRVLGVDIIPAQPPKGVSTIQGNFLSPDVQANIRSFLRDPDRGRTLRPHVYSNPNSEHSGDVAIDAEMRGYIDRERHNSLSEVDEDKEADKGKIIDVVLSDMCEPWEQTSGFYNRTLSDPYLRMMNTSGNNFRDHAGSMVRLDNVCAAHGCLIGNMC